MSAALDPRAEYDRRIARWSEAIAQGDRRHLLISNLRLAIALAAAVVFWLAFVTRPFPVAGSSCRRSAFSPVVVHALVLQRNERGAGAARLSARPRPDERHVGRHRPDGARFLGEHPYARDLDLVRSRVAVRAAEHGAHRGGEETLADWLRGRAGSTRCARARRAVDELRPMLDFREDVAVLAAEAPGRPHRRARGVGEHAGVGPAADHRHSAWRVAALTTVALIVLAFSTSSTSAWCLLGVRSDRPRRDLAPQIRRVLHAHRHARARLSSARQPAGAGRARSRSRRRACCASHQAGADGVPPSTRIARLQTLVSWLDSTHNLLFAPFALLILVRSSWRSRSIAGTPRTDRRCRVAARRRRARGAGRACDLRLRASARSVSRAGRRTVRCSKPTAWPIR